MDSAQPHSLQRKRFDEWGSDLEQIHRVEKATVLTRRTFVDSRQPLTIFATERNTSKRTERADQHTCEPNTSFLIQPSSNMFSTSTTTSPGDTMPCKQRPIDRSKRPSSIRIHTQDRSDSHNRTWKKSTHHRIDWIKEKKPQSTTMHHHDVSRRWWPSTKEQRCCKRKETEREKP